jgi:hypothetical protein
VKDLSKMVVKYKNKPEQILNDLRKKYKLPIQEFAYLNEIRRLIFVYSVPEVFYKIIPNLNYETYTYNEAFDVSSNKFDSLESLRSKIIIAPRLNIPPLDNLSKFKNSFDNQSYIISGHNSNNNNYSFDGNNIFNNSNNNSFSSNSNNNNINGGEVINKYFDTTTTQNLTLINNKKTDSTTKSTSNFFQKIAEYSIKQNINFIRKDRQTNQSFNRDSSNDNDQKNIINIDEKSLNSFIASPFKLIYNLMNNKIRAKIIVRRHTGFFFIYSTFIRSKLSDL